MVDLETEKFINYRMTIVYVVTTIQLNENIKRALDRMKSNKETYEEVILNLMRIAEKCKREKKELLIEGCKEMAEENLKITKEFEAIENLENWEW